MNKIRKNRSNYKDIKKIEDKKVNNNSESYEINKEYENNNYNDIINPYIIENKILDNLNENENEDIEINNKKNKKVIYRQNFDNNKINNFDDINKKRNFKNEKQKYEMIYSNLNKNNDEIKDNSDEENSKNSNMENSNGRDEDSDDNNMVNENNENNYLNNNHFNNVESHFKKNNINKKFMTKVLNLNNNENENENQKNKYEDEINRLKEEIANLENDNDFLSSQLIEEEKKNEELHLLKNEKEENDNSILSDISHCLQVNSFDEILPKLTEMINYLTKYNNDKTSKMKEDVISKLKSLYIITNDSKKKKDNISIQDLWRWIKNLVEEVDELSLEKEKYEEIYNRNNNDLYKNFCEKLIKEFGLNSFEELKFFINDLMTKNDLNKKRVEKLRKVLMNNNEDINDKEESFRNKVNYKYQEENEYENNINNIRMNNNHYRRFNSNFGTQKFKQNYYYNDNQF